MLTSSSVSTYVTMKMITADGVEFRMAQMASDFLIIRNVATEHPPGDAEIILTVDGEPTRIRSTFPMASRRASTAPR